MTKDPPSSATGQRKSKAHRFYIVGFSFPGRRPNWEVENLDVLLAGAFALFPPTGSRGFPAYSEKPRLVIGKRKDGHPPRDMEEFHSYWLISDPLKVLFESIDSQAFAFQSCDVKLADGSAGPIYWLCDVVWVLDALNEGTKQRITYGRSLSSIVRSGTLVFKGDVIGNAHIFRMAHPRSVSVFCNQKFKDYCKQARMKGIRFVDCAVEID
jgi:hypothetical protein